MRINKKGEESLQKLYLSGLSLSDISDISGLSLIELEKKAKDEAWDSKARSFIENSFHRELLSLLSNKTISSKDKISLANKLTSSLARLQSKNKIKQDSTEHLFSANKFKQLLDKVLSDTYGLYDYQRSFLLDKSRFRVALKARQIGFSYLIGLDALLEGAKGEDSIIVSASQEQANIIIEYSKVHCEKLGIDLITKKRNELVLPNKSKIIAKAANYRTVQGFSGNIYFDEFAWIYNSKLLFEIAAPVASLQNRRITIVSTPFEMGSFFYHLMQGTGGMYQNFSRHKVTVYDAIKEGCPIDITELRNLYDSESFENLFLCSYFESGSSLISYDVLLQAQGDCLKKDIRGEVFAGFDVGRYKDLSEIILVELRDKVYVRQIYSLKRVPFDEQKKIVRELMGKYNINKLFVDCTGIGLNISEDLAVEFPTKIEKVYFTNTIKEELALNLKELFDTNRIVIPSDKELISQLHSIKKEAGEARIKYVYHGNQELKGHADKFWALALACRYLCLGSKKTIKVKLL